MKSLKIHLDYNLRVRYTINPLSQRQKSISLGKNSYDSDRIDVRAVINEWLAHVSIVVAIHNLCSGNKSDTSKVIQAVLAMNRQNDTGTELSERWVLLSYNELR